MADHDEYIFGNEVTVILAENNWNILIFVEFFVKSVQNVDRNSFDFNCEFVAIDYSIVQSNQPMAARNSYGNTHEYGDSTPTIRSR